MNYDESALWDELQEFLGDMCADVEVMAERTAQDNDILKQDRFEDIIIGTKSAGRLFDTLYELYLFYIEKYGRE